MSGEGGTPAKDAAPAAQATRGPFEPLVSSVGTHPVDTHPVDTHSGNTSSGDTRSGGMSSSTAPPSLVTQDAPATSASVAPAQTPGGGGKHAASGTVGSDGPQDSALAQARRLEQIKDFYLTAEAIGERNVDKHFDQLMAQQRELISDYFKQSSTARPGDGPAQAAPEAANPERPDLPASSSGHSGNPQEPPSSASIIADQPQVW